MFIDKSFEYTICDIYNSIEGSTCFYYFLPYRPVQFKKSQYAGRANNTRRELTTLPTATIHMFIDIKLQCLYIRGD